MRTLTASVLFGECDEMRSPNLPTVINGTMMAAMPASKLTSKSIDCEPLKDKAQEKLLVHG